MEINNYRATLQADSGKHTLIVTASSEEDAIFMIQKAEGCPRWAILHIQKLMPDTKLVEYAYPTSTTAKKAGFGKTGCWFVALYKEDTFSRRSILDYFLEKEAATAYADSLPNPYHWMHHYLLEKAQARAKESGNNN
ncbi:hypothetical protein [Puia dinghuensis]|uniref:Uncharacterized protein n=1 Tax=Puia dinghuensis TaxID=1792502 RepID=A0A8J2UB75_9BACT|nr:hypothetical protein [Puia dinghuensis]GGA92642.1 hypothetical protein GCM10011511_15040 [Puia dinghuensis]